jgi:hypothetical protein
MKVYDVSLAYQWRSKRRIAAESSEDAARRAELMDRDDPDIWPRFATLRNPAGDSAKEVDAATKAREEKIKEVARILESMEDDDDILREVAYVLGVAWEYAE